jgi:hypothetical protein
MRSRISRTGWRGRLTAGLALIIAIAVVIAIVLGASSSSTPAASGNASNAAGATTVQRRNLVETDTESGTLSYANPQTVYNRLSGTITWLPSVGQAIKPGQTLYKVDGDPVTLLNGTTPAYRDLGPADSDGPDITQLNRNLVALGFNPDGITIDDQWQAATTAAVELFQESLGESPTGTLSLGQVVFLPGDQLITTLDATVGSTGSGGSSPTGSDDTTALDPAPAPDFVSLKRTTPCPTGITATTTTTTPCRATTPAKHRTGSKSPTNRQTLAALIALLKAETAELNALKHAQGSGAKPSGTSSSPKPSGSKSGSGSSGSGSTGSTGSGDAGSSGSGASGGGDATAILQTTSTQLVVTVDLSASSQSEAVLREHVTVEMPNGSVVGGVITAVSPVAQSSSGSGSGGSSSGSSGSGGSGSGGSGNGSSGSSSTIPVTVALSGHVSGAGLDQAAVSVNFAEAKASNVLSVPVTALLATSGDSYAVQEAASPHRLIPVTTGLFAAGYVAISGPGIYPGLQVTDSQG